MVPGNLTAVGVGGHGLLEMAIGDFTYTSQDSYLTLVNTAAVTALVVTKGLGAGTTVTEEGVSTEGLVSIEEFPTATTYYGDSPIKQMALSQAWGINPAAAEIECVGILAPALDESMWLTIGGTTWFGRVKKYEKKTNEGGVTTTISLVDTRDLLMQSCIYGQFNMRDADGALYHLFPGDDWYYKEKFYPGIRTVINGVTHYTWEADPLTPRTIILYILSSTGFTYQPTSARVQNILNSRYSVCHDIDWNLGKKRGLALLEICDLLGLHFAIGDDPDVLLIGRKGEVVNFLSGNFTDHAEGMERLFNDNRVTVIGDPNIYELTDMPLVQDWPAAWDSVVWDTTLMQLLRDIDPDNPLSVTVEQMDGEYYDAELHAGYPRYEMLAVDYANTIPFKVYALDLTSTITLNSHESTLSDLMPIYDRLVSDIDSQVAVKCTGFIGDPQRPLQLAELVTDCKAGGYEVDRAKGKVIFHDRKFKGDFLTQVGNQYKLDYTAIIPDEPLLTFTIQRELFQATWGTGNRKGSHHVRNLRWEYICATNGTITDTIDRGVLPTDFFAQYVASLITGKPASAATGFVKRNGQCGYRMSDAFDRITTTLDGVAGITENVTYASEQPQIGIPSEREMERRVKATAPKTDLQKANEVWDAVQAAIAGGKSVTARVPANGDGGTPEDMAVTASVMDPGGIISAKNYGATFEFADVLCGNGIDATTGQHNVKDPSTVVSDDPSFLGVVAQDCVDADFDVKLKSSGLVTLKVDGVVAVGDDLGLAAGEKYCEAGKSGVGIAKEVNASGIGYIRAQLGAGSGGGLIYTEEETNPGSPVSGSLNINRQPTTSHFWIYDGAAWRRLLGFM